MYPTIEVFSFKIYTFGITMACTWLLFIILLHRFALQRGIIRPIFSDIVSFTLSIFFFSRIFHIFTDWLNEKFILMELVHGNFLGFLKLFFIPQDFLFSLFGAIFGFCIIFIIKTHHFRKDRPKYLDAIVYAFLFSSILGYIASFLGGQVYGIPLSSPISVTYNHIDSIVKDRSPLFPLALFYMITNIGIVFGLCKFSLQKTLPDGFIGYIGIGLFSVILFFGEYLSGSRKDIFYDYFSLGLNQIGALIGIIFAIVGILRIIQKRV